MDAILICDACDRFDPRYTCGKCGKTKYCSKECQLQHWTKSHKNACAKKKAPIVSHEQLGLGKSVTRMAIEKKIQEKKEANPYDGDNIWPMDSPCACERKNPDARRHWIAAETGLCSGPGCARKLRDQKKIFYGYLLFACDLGGPLEGQGHMISCFYCSPECVKNDVMNGNKIMLAHKKEEIESE